MIYEITLNNNIINKLWLGNHNLLISFGNWDFDKIIFFYKISIFYDFFVIILFFNFSPKIYYDLSNDLAIYFRVLHNIKHYH